MHTCEWSGAARRRRIAQNCAEAPRCAVRTMPPDMYGYGPPRTGTAGSASCRGGCRRAGCRRRSSSRRPSRRRTPGSGGAAPSRATSCGRNRRRDPASRARAGAAPPRGGRGGRACRRRPCSRRTAARAAAVSHHSADFLGDDADVRQPLARRLEHEEVVLVVRALVRQRLGRRAVQVPTKIAAADHERLPRRAVEVRRPQPQVSRRAALSGFVMTPRKTNGSRGSSRHRAASSETLSLAGRTCQHPPTTTSRALELPGRFCGCMHATN